MTTTPDIQAAVERLKAEAQDELDAHVEWLIVNPSEQDPGPEDISVSPRTLLAILSALAEANERAMILETAVHERCAERDEAREFIRSLKGVCSSFCDGDGDMVAGQITARIEAFLNPQQEWGRDHG